MTQRIIPNYESLAFSPGLPQLARKTLVNQYFKIYALPCRITSLLSCSSLSLLPVPGCHFCQECLRMKVSTAASSHIAKVQTLQRIKLYKISTVSKQFIILYWWTKHVKGFAETFLSKPDTKTLLDIFLTARHNGLIHISLYITDIILNEQSLNHLTEVRTELRMLTMMLTPF